MKALIELIKEYEIRLEFLEPQLNEVGKTIRQGCDSKLLFSDLGFKSGEIATLKGVIRDLQRL